MSTTQHSSWVLAGMLPVVYDTNGVRRNGLLQRCTIENRSQAILEYRGFIRMSPGQLAARSVTLPAGFQAGTSMDCLSIEQPLPRIAID